MSVVRPEQEPNLAVVALAEATKKTEQLVSVVTELEHQLQDQVVRDARGAKMLGDAERAVQQLAAHAREESEALRLKLLTAEAEVKRLSLEVEKWKR